MVNHVQLRSRPGTHRDPAAKRAIAAAREANLRLLVKRGEAIDSAISHFEATFPQPGSTSIRPQQLLQALANLFDRSLFEDPERIAFVTEDVSRVTPNEAREIHRQAMSAIEAYRSASLTPDAWSTFRSELSHLIGTLSRLEAIHRFEIPAAGSSLLVRVQRLVEHSILGRAPPAGGPETWDPPLGATKLQLRALEVEEAIDRFRRSDWGLGAANAFHAALKMPTPPPGGKDWWG